MVDPSAPHVKPRRGYDSSRRRAAAAANRARVLEAARSRFLGQGYAETTVGDIAADAGVSVESVYRLTGGKAGLVRALCEDALLGELPEPAERRSDRLAAGDATAAEVVRGWADLLCEVSPRISRLHLLARAGSAADPGLADLVRDLERARLSRMTHNADVLLRARGVRPRVTVQHAAEVLWLYSAPEWFERLVLVRGWTARAYADFVGAAIAAALLGDEPD